MFNQYTSLPKEIMAVQFLEENKDRIFNSLTGQYAAGFEDGKPIIKVKTIHGETAIVRLGDWIVKEKELGFYYPVKDEVFRAGYFVKPDLLTQKKEELKDLVNDIGHELMTVVNIVLD